MLAPVAVRAMVNVAPWHESFAEFVIEIAFARSTFALPLTAPTLAGTSQPPPLLSCGEVTVTVDGAEVLQGRGSKETASIQAARPFAREPGLYRIRIRYRSLAEVPLNWPVNG